MSTLIRLFPLLLILAACSDDTPSQQLAAATAPDAVTATAPATNPEFNAQRNAYFGDLHVHTMYSFVAFILHENNQCLNLVEISCLLQMGPYAQSNGLRSAMDCR